MLRDSGLEELNDNDIEALQTDVMRFIAILAFCLLVIFIPLVRSIPERTTAPAMVEEHRQLEREVQRLSATATQQAEEIQALRGQLQESAGRLAQLTELEAAVRQRDRELADLRDGLQSRNLEAQELSRRLTQLNRTLAQTEAQLATARQSTAPNEAHRAIPALKHRAAAPPPLEAKTPPRSEPAAKRQEPVPPPEPEPQRGEQQPEDRAPTREPEPQRGVQPSETPASDSAARPQRAAPPPEAAASVPESQPQQDQERPSEILFASQGALLHLLNAGEVVLLLQTDKAVFELATRRGEMAYRRVRRLSGELYTMPDALVPPEVQEVTRTYLADMPESPRHYYLKLAPRIQRTLTRTIAAHSSGRFIITREGTVTYEAYP